MKLTADNYYSQESNRAYWSASFVKSMLNCPSQALAELNGDYIRDSSAALLIGSYVDSYFEGAESFEAFVSEHSKEIINSRTGELKSDFRLADEMIRRAEQDDVFKSFCEGEKQTILTGDISGIPFKCKLDFYVPGKRIVDLKTVKDMESMYKPGQGKVSFIEYWNWALQMAIYQHIEGNHLPCYLAVITKQNPPDIAVIEIPQHILDAEMKVLADKLPMFDAMRQGIVEPERCEGCTWCRQSKVLTGAVSMDEFSEI